MMGLGINDELFELQLKTPTQRMVANYIFGNSAYKHEGSEIADVISEQLGARFGGVDEISTELTFFCEPEKKPMVIAAWAAILQHYKTIEFVTPEFAEDICMRAKQDYAPVLPQTPKSSSAPKTP